MTFDIDSILASLQEDGGMSKQASATETPPNELTKEAAREYGRSLAQSLIKQANQINEDQEAIAATQTAQTQPTPDGSIDDVLRALAAQAEQGGGVDEDPTMDSLLARIAANLSPNPGEPGQGKLLATEAATTDVEKVAALAELIDGGVDFDTASEIVKEASAGEYVDKGVEKAKKVGQYLLTKAKAGGNLAWKHKGAIGLTAGGAAAGAGAMHLYNKRKDQEKQAALAELVDGGVDFDTAAGLVKEAGPRGPLLSDAMRRYLGMAPAPAAAPAASGSKVDAALRKLREAGSFVANKAKAGGNLAWKHKGAIGLAAGGAAAGAGAVHLYNKRKDQEKQAALDSLMEAGVDFDTASELVKEASASEYVDMGVAKAKQMGNYLLDRAKAGGNLAWKHKGAIGLTAGGAAAGAGAMHLYNKRKDQEKQAALDSLMEAGVDFDTAAEITSDAYAE